MFLLNRMILIACVVSLLAACGGGGGDSGTSSSVPANTAFPVAAAMTTLFQTGTQKGLTISGSTTGIYSGITYPVSGNEIITIGASQPSVFNGISGYSLAETVILNLTVNGGSGATNFVAVNYLNSSYQPIGAASTSTYCVASNPFVYPVSATSGQAGILGTNFCYSNSSKSTLLGKTVYSWTTVSGSEVGNANALGFLVLSELGIRN